MISTVSFSDDQGRKYEWRGFGPGLQMVVSTLDIIPYSPVIQTLLSQLFEKGGKGGIAEFKRSRLDHATQTLSPAILTLDPRATEIIDLVVISFLVLEKDRRIDDTSTSNKADALTLSNIGVGNVLNNDNVRGHGV